MNENKPFIRPVLSVIIASQNAVLSVENCLLEIKNQCAPYDSEIIVVDNSTDETVEIIKNKFTDIVVVQEPKSKLIPELWAIGIKISQGNLVLLTTTHFIPKADWLAEILNAHKSNYAGIGGAIENDPEAGLVAWAIYFCRYTRYMLPFAKKNVNDFAADNASYKRDALELVKESFAGGFWEPFVHQAMIKEKMELGLSPDIIVYHQDSFKFSAFLRQRFEHGKRFGIDRVKKIPTTQRIAYALCSPLIPFLYLYRITIAVKRKRRNIGKYLLSMPILILFLTSWSIGEFWGYISKPE